MYVVLIIHCQQLLFVVAFFGVYLVDGVTGATIHHTTHRNAAGPVNLELSENWIVVSFSHSWSLRNVAQPGTFKKKTFFDFTKRYNN